MDTIHFENINTSEFLLKELFELTKNQHNKSFSQFRSYIYYNKIAFKKATRLPSINQTLHELLNQINTDRYCLKQLHDIINPKYEIKRSNLKKYLNTHSFKYIKKYTNKNEKQYTNLFQNIKTKEYTLKQLHEKTQYQGSLTQFKQLVYKNNIMFKSIQHELKKHKKIKVFLDSLETENYTIKEILLLIKEEKFKITEGSLRHLMSELKYPFKRAQKAHQDAEKLRQIDTSQYTLKEIHQLINSEQKLKTLYYYLVNKGYEFKRENK